MMDMARQDFSDCSRLQLPDALKGPVSFGLAELAAANEIAVAM